ncbi:hypothetical protein D5086_014167 [Populus alba]|uniref:Uncharacterized protein n=1 Tax=Populus alba TaxID=43335 RepID=A0ACC4C8R2_POPAL
MTYEIVSHKNAGEAFGLTEIELGFMYNRLYSKVTEISSLRIILHSITFLSSISALISFSIMTLSKNVYSKKDTMISYLLLVGAVLLDCYSITVFFTSDWGVLWLGGIEMPFHIFGRISFPLPAFCMKRKRWSTSMGQHSLISALSKKPVNKILKNFLGKWNVDSREKVGKELKELIFKQVLNKRSRYDPSTDDFNALEKLLEQRGLEVLRSKHCFHRFEWSVAAVEFIHSLLTWHIATHVCFSDDSRKNAFDKTRNCSLEAQDGWSNDKKWEMISEVWVDMLMYAASHSVWKEHVHALARGGELLTHVCLLMAHLGLNGGEGGWKAGLVVGGARSVGRRKQNRWGEERRPEVGVGVKDGGAAAEEGNGRSLWFLSKGKGNEGALGLNVEDEEMGWLGKGRGLPWAAAGFW